MSDVFISYSRKDKEFVRKLYDALAARERDVWVDWEDIPLTAEWQKEIFAGIESANTFVFVISPDSAASKICGEEIAHAVALNKRMVPILYRDVPEPNVPAPLRPINWIFFRAADDFDARFQELLGALDTDLDWVRAHTRLLTRAIEWDSKKRNDAFVLRGADLRTAEEWMAQAATGKEPKPTPLQSEYLLASRRSATRQQRIVLTGVTIALVVAVVLAVIAVFQSNEATNQKNAALNQARISDARRLAAQSLSNREQNFDLALLLGVEALRLDSNLEVRSNLLDALTSRPQLMGYLRSPVASMAFSLDGKVLAAGSDNKIILWDMSTRQPLGQPFSEDTAGIRSVAFSPDGMMIASGSCAHVQEGDCDAGQVHLWDVSTHQPIGQPLRGYKQIVYSVAFSPDGKTLATASRDGTIILWDVNTRQTIGEPIPRYASSNLAFSPDGKMLAAASSGTTLTLWDVKTRQPIDQPFPPNGIGRFVESVAFSPDGKVLASGIDDGSIILWDVNTHQPIAQPLKGHRGAVNTVAFSPDGKMLASSSCAHHSISSACDIGEVYLWDVGTRQPIGQPFTEHKDDVNSVAFSPDGKILTSGGGDATIILRNVSTSHPIAQPLAGSKNSGRSVAFSPDGRMLVSGGYDGMVVLWDATTRQPSAPPLTGHKGSVIGVVFSPDGKKLASGGYDGTIILWDMDTRQPIGSPLNMPFTGHANPVASVAFSPDGKILASASADNTIILWDVNTQQPLGVPLKGQTGGFVMSIAFSPDGKMLASGTSDSRIILWDVNTHAQIGQPLVQQNSFVYSVAFSPDGKLLASGNGDNSVILWDVSARQRVGQSLTGHTSYVLSVAFSPDGKTLVSASYDNKIILWDVVTRQSIAQPLSGSKSSVLSIAYSPDGKTLASGGCVTYQTTGGVCATGEVILWDLDDPAWANRACKIANRNLTIEEWKQYINPDPAAFRATCPGLPLGK